MIQITLDGDEKEHNNIRSTDNSGSYNIILNNIENLIDNYFVNVTTGGFGLTVDDESVNLKFLTAIINSKLLDWYLKG